MTSMGLMGKHVMKEAPDVDFYVEWSSIVESWTAAGTRAEILEYLHRDSDPYLRDDAPHHPERRLERADETGTTSLWVTAAGMRDKYPEEGAWDDTGTIYMQRGVVSRANLFELVRRQSEDPNAEIEDLLSPFEDGCRCDHAFAAHGTEGCADCGCLMRVASGKVHAEG